MHKLFIYAKLFHIGLFIINLSCLIFNIYKIFTHPSTSNSIFIYLLGAIICALGTLITFILMIRELLK